MSKLLNISLTFIILINPSPLTDITSSSTRNTMSERSLSLILLKMILSRIIQKKMLNTRNMPEFLK